MLVFLSQLLHSLLMRKRVIIALSVLAVALVGVVVWEVVKPSDEPVYKGKPLSFWLSHPSAYWDASRPKMAS